MAPHKRFSQTLVSITLYDFCEEINIFCICSVVHNFTEEMTPVMKNILYAFSLLNINNLAMKIFLVDIVFGSR